MLKIALYDTEIYHQYKQTPSVQSMGTVRLLLICQFVKL